jgi:hypothetical protein
LITIHVSWLLYTMPDTEIAFWQGAWRCFSIHLLPFIHEPFLNDPWIKPIVKLVTNLFF